MRPILSFAFLCLPALLTAQEDPAVMARAVVAQINWARQDPKACAEVLQTWLPRFEDERYLSFPGEPRLKTEEGPAAVREAIAFLGRQKPLSPLVWSDELSRAASGLVKDQSASGGVGHEGSDGSSPFTRILRHLPSANHSGEVLTYGTFGDPPSAQRAVLALIVDDGVQDRGHRALIFDTSFTLAGAAWGSHPTFKRMVAVDLAEAPRSTMREAVPPLGKMAESLLIEVNRARANPKACALELRDWLEHFKSDGTLALPGELAVRTREGALAVRAAITFLESQTPLPPLKADEALDRVARSLIKSQEVVAGTTAADLGSRLKGNATAAGGYVECLRYGYFGSPASSRRAVLDMIVSDGTATKAQQKAIFNPTAESMGAAWGDQGQSDQVVVIEICCSS